MYYLLKDLEHEKLFYIVNELKQTVKKDRYRLDGIGLRDCVILYTTFDISRCKTVASQLGRSDKLKSCHKSCSPGDFHKNGKCSNNGCYYEVKILT